MTIGSWPTFTSLQSKFSRLLQHIDEKLPGCADSGKSDGLPGSAGVEIDHFILSFALNSNEAILV